MVLTGPVRMSKTGQTRRRLLGTGLGVAAGTALAGCSGDDGPAPPSAADPLAPLLDEALALAAAYDRAAVAQPGLAGRLTPLAADHRAHVTELTRVIGSAGAKTAPPSAGSDAADVIAGLRDAELAAQKTAANVCRQAPAGRTALAGSIAACRATHAEALR
jgi:hypothetical protein